MKNILIIIASLKHGGGAEKVATTIGSSLYEKGYNIHFLTFYDVKEKYEFKGKYFSFNEKSSNNIFINIFKLFIRAYKIKRYCKENDIETSISHMNESNFSNILSKIIFGNKTKIIIQIHASLHIVSYLYKKIISFLYPLSDLIITIVEEEKLNLINKFNIKDEKIKVIHNPINISEINVLKTQPVKNSEKIFKNNDIFSFINIGRLTYQKNQELLIKVFKKFNEKYPNTQLLILGKGELKGNLEKLINNNDKIYLLGKQLNPYNYLYKSNCFLFTSRYEGFGIVLIEGMACGLPIISTNCKTGPKEILRNDKYKQDIKIDVSLEEYGILTSISNLDDIFQAMEKIYLNENVRKKYETKSLERSKDFEINEIIKKWEKIIK